MQNKKYSRISLIWTTIAKLAIKTHLQHLQSKAIMEIKSFLSRIEFCLYICDFTKHDFTHFFQKMGNIKLIHNNLNATS